MLLANSVFMQQHCALRERPCQCVSRNSEVARLCGKKPLTWLATLATLSPGRGLKIDHRWPPSRSSLARSIIVDGPLRPVVFQFGLDATLSGCGKRASVILRSRRRRRICIFLIFTMHRELQILREVYPERANCRPFAALRVTANGLRMTGRWNFFRSQLARPFGEENSHYEFGVRHCLLPGLLDNAHRLSYRSRTSRY